MLLFCVLKKTQPMAVGGKSMISTANYVVSWAEVVLTARFTNGYSNCLGTPAGFVHAPC